MKFTVTFPIVAKMIVVSVILLICASFPITFKSSQLFAEMSEKRESDANLDQAVARSSEIENILMSYLDRIKLVSAIALKARATSGNTQSEITEFALAEDRDFVAIDIYERNEKGPQIIEQLQKDQFFEENNLPKDYLKLAKLKLAFPVPQVFSGKIEILNFSQQNGVALLALGIPLVASDSGQVINAAVGFVRLDRIQKTFAQSGVRSTYLVDSQGRALGHKNERWVLDNHNLKYLEIVERSIESKAKVGQIRFFDHDAKEFFVGAYSKNSMGLVVIAQAPERLIQEPAQAMRREAYRIAGWVLSGAILLIFLFSMTLTSPLERLLEITYEIGKGNFNVRNDVISMDEVGALAMAIRKMVNGLKERDRAKEIFRKFHGSAAEEIMKGDLSLGGKKKDITVFFSDLREFTKFSEGHTPEEVVEMLNEYFQVMVSVATSNHGFVDKFVGDAMMVSWGIPKSSGEDQFWAVKAAIEMRKALVGLNDVRKKKGRPAIKMGMGIHCGEAIVGQMGSSERMEYTAIGDTVNQASRIESSTKSFGTDLLISEAVADSIRSRFIVAPAGEVEVKGKSEPLKLFKVNGFIGANGEKIVVETPYSSYQPADADKVKLIS